MNDGMELRRIREAITRDYVAATPRSSEVFERASVALTGGSTGNLRTFPPHPLYFSEGAGPTMTDVDGRVYTDYFLCNGPMLLGHRHPEIEAAVRDAAQLGSMVVNPVLAVKAAEAIVRLVPCAELVRFLNSGTEAVLTAVRLARAFTGNDVVVKFAGHYHGQDDQFLVGIDSLDGHFGAGIPITATACTVVARYGDLESLRRLVRSRDDIAAIVLDPAMHAGGLWGSQPGFLAAVRELTRERGVVLIFDEVITGFRLSPGGAQSHFGVVPDLVTLGKALGAGEKIAAVAGRADIMRATIADLRGAGRVFQSGTANDATAGLAAVIGALAAYERLDRAGEYEALTERTRRLATGIRSALEGVGIPATVNQFGPMIQLFIGRVDDDIDSIADADQDLRGLLLLALAVAGELVSLPNSSHVYTSFVHSDVHIDHTLAVLGSVLDRYQITDAAFDQCAGHAAR